MRRHRMVTVALTAVIAATCYVPAIANELFFEDFEGLTLGDSVNERIGTAVVTREATDTESDPIPGVWSATTPDWTVDNDLNTYNSAPTVTGAGVPGQGQAAYGVDEWEGWGFAKIDFWNAVDGQGRGDFGTSTAAAGTIAVADPDEYFDLDNVAADEDPDEVNNATLGGYYSSSLTSPSFNVVAGTPYGLGFDSSWRDESFDDNALGDTFVDQNNQSVEIIVNFNNGSQTIVQWDSDSATPADGVPFKDDAQDENFVGDGSNLNFTAPAGATSASISFNIANAGNDWWWALDNIEVNDVSGFSPVTVYSEDFEDTTLGESVNERSAPGSPVTVPSDEGTIIAGVPFPTTAVPNAFTHTTPDGWDNPTSAPDVGNDDLGVFEWERWSFADKDFWANVAGQQRENFANATGTVAIADSDEWDDLDHADGRLTTMLVTPEISLLGYSEVELAFDSSYRAEGGQTISVEAILDGDVGNPVTLLARDGDSGDFVAEDVSLLLNTAGASTVQFVFNYDGDNNWWWAVDNVRVTGIPEPSSLLLLGLAISAGVVARVRRCS